MFSADNRGIQPRTFAYVTLAIRQTRGIICDSFNLCWAKGGVPCEELSSHPCAQRTLSRMGSQGQSHEGKHSSSPEEFGTVAVAGSCDKPPCVDIVNRRKHISQTQPDFLLHVSLHQEKNNNSAPHQKVPWRIPTLPVFAFSSCDGPVF